MSSNTNQRWLAFVYAATIFVSAFLLFQIQPMISKAILPWFGGTPAVWTICLLFFQSLLFAGYAYAHFTNSWLRPWQQAIGHILVMAVALALLGVLPDSSRQPRGDADPTRSILTILAITIGLPYFVLSATGPLLQAWFARSFPGRTPYRLYALSNVGSLLALLSYPFLFERQFDLTEQARLWSAGFIAFAFLCAYAAWQVRKIEPSPSGRGLAKEPSPSGRGQGEGALGSDQTNTPSPQPSPTGRGSEFTPHYMLWLLLPAFASVVLMATTNHISTDVAVVPLLWVVPLSLYLVTFIIAFDRPAWYRPILTAALTLVAIYPTSAMYKKNNVGLLKLYDCGMTGRVARKAADFFTSRNSESEQEAGEKTSAFDGPSVRIGFRSALIMNFAAMFGICMLCHGQLARLKPPTQYLTAYYLMMSAGGALGGIAVSLIAPHVFRTIFEWQLAIFVAALAAVGIILQAVVNRVVGPVQDPSQSNPEARLSLVPRLLLPVLLVCAAFMFLDLVEFLFSPHKGAVYESRNFFGALTIRENNPDDPANRELVLLNGTTLHGAQFMASDRRGQPSSYYGTPSGIGKVFNYFRAHRPPGGIRIGDVGLGTGTVAAFGTKFDTLRFYEINPTVIDISTSGKWFTYIPDCLARGATCDIKLGDARLTLESELGDEKMLPYHILILDAFSGDAVPTHLLTKEAMDIYLPHVATDAKMGVDGALLIHVSNRYLNLERVARGAADYIGYEIAIIHSPSVEAQSINSADWCVLTRNKGLLAALEPFTSKPSPDDKPPVLWTDAHTSLFEILR